MVSETAPIAAAVWSDAAKDRGTKQKPGVLTQGEYLPECQSRKDRFLRAKEWQGVVNVCNAL